MLIEVRTLDKNSNPLKVSKGDTPPIQHTVEPNTRIEIYVDGQKQNGQSAAGTPSKKLTKVGKNLVLTEEDKPLIELVNFYDEAKVTVVGEYWSAADTQLTAVSEGLAFQEAAPAQVGALVAAGPSTLTWALGGLAAVGLGSGGGGGGGGSSAATDAAASANAAIASALAVIKNYNGSNTVPTANHYRVAGVTGIVDGTDGNKPNLGAVNSAIALLSEDATNTAAKVQVVVNAYKAVLAFADGTSNSTNAPTQAQYAALGIQGVDTTEAKNLLNDAIDNKSNDDVNTVEELQDLANAVAAVMKTAKGDTSALVTVSQLKALGITGLDDRNIDISVLQAVLKNTDDVNKVDSLSELQEIVNNMAMSQAKIKNFAIDTKLEADVPTTTDYSNIGVTGVAGVAGVSLATINSSIAPLSADVTDTTAKVQAVVNAYKAILDNANGTNNSDDTNFMPPSKEQYVAIGVNSFKDLTDDQLQPRAALLGSVIDRKVNANVDTLAKLEDLAKVVDKVMRHAAGRLGANESITQIELQALGLTGVDGVNKDNIIKDFLNKVNASDDNGTGINSLKALQNMVDDKSPIFYKDLTKHTVDDRGVFMFEMTEGNVSFVIPLPTDQGGINGDYTFTLSNNDGNFFKIIPQNKEALFALTPFYDIPKDGESNNSYYFSVTATDKVGNKTEQFYGVIVKDDPDLDSKTRPLGAGNGQLLAPIRVEGKLYYHWDKNGNGMIDVGDAVTGVELNNIFNKNFNGEALAAGVNRNDEYRYANLGGIRLALPTLGIYSDARGNFDKKGTNYDLVDKDSKNKIQSNKFDDLFAIWDAYNGSNETLEYEDDGRVVTGAQNGTPPGWMNKYWSSTPGSWIDNHRVLDFSTGNLWQEHRLSGTDKNGGRPGEIIYAAFQVL